MQKIQSSLKGQTKNSEASVSLYVDYENIKINQHQAKFLIDFAQSQGNLLSKKTYAKESIWKQGAGKDRANLENLGIDCIDVPLETKNSVDFRLVIDSVCEAVSQFPPKIFILVGADGDYETLVQELHSRGKEVIVFYQEGKASQQLIQTADKSYLINQLPELVNQKANILNVDCQIPYNEAINCLIESIKTALEQGKHTKFSLIDSLMRSNQRFPNYHGVSSIQKADGTQFRQFKDFISAVVADGKVQVRTVGNFQELLLIRKNTKATKKSYSVNTDDDNPTYC